MDRRKTNFLNELYGFNYNNAPLVPINDANIKSKIERYSQDGYIVISCRIDDIKVMINDIKALATMGFSYTPIYACFIENRGNVNEKYAYYPSFIVYNKNRDCVTGKFEELLQHGLVMCRKYDIDFILVQAPNTNPKYVKQNGEVCVELEEGKVFNDISKEYFEYLRSNIDEFSDMPKTTQASCSLLEVYKNPKQESYAEGHVRYLWGEVF